MCMQAPVANAQADQIQALRHFHGYPLDFFLSPLMVADHFHEPLGRITKPLDRSRKAIERNEP